jgi:transcriptional regulator with XRE-family HTH domain
MWERRRRKTAAQHRKRMLADPISSRLRRARLAAGLSLGELGERVFLAKNTLSYYELGKNPVPRRSQAMIAAVLGVPAAYLFDERRYVRRSEPGEPATDAGGLLPAHHPEWMH